MDAVALSQEEKAYFETGGEAVPSSVSDIPQTQDDAGVPQDNPAPVENNDNDTQQTRDERGRFVPHQALHAEREERKRFQRESEEVKQKLAVLEDRWNTLLKLQEQPKQDAPSGPPDPEQDIFAAIKWQQETLLKQQQEREAELKQRQEYEQQTQAEREISTYWQSSVQDYSTREPDFQPAAQWLSEYRHKQLEALAPIDPRMANPAARNAQIDAELKQIIAVARQNQQNPAELVHQLAKGWGYNGQAQAQNTQVPDTLAKLEQAQAASRTLAATGGKTGADPLTADAILSMSNDEFSKWIEEPGNQSRFNKMMGGR